MGLLTRLLRALPVSGPPPPRRPSHTSGPAPPCPRSHATELAAHIVVELADDVSGDRVELRSRHPAADGRLTELRAALPVITRNGEDAVRLAAPRDLLDSLYRLTELWVGELQHRRVDEPDGALLRALLQATSAVRDAAGGPPLPAFLDSLTESHPTPHQIGGAHLDVGRLARRYLHPEAHRDHPHPAVGAAVTEGWDHAESGNLHGARTRFEDAMHDGGPHGGAEAAVALGVFLHEYSSASYDPEGAKAAYQRAIDSGHPDHAPGAAFSLGVMLEDEGDLTGARAAYERCLDDPRYGPRARNCLRDLAQG